MQERHRGYFGNRVNDAIRRIEMAIEEDFIDEAVFERMRQAEKSHPATEHTNAGGWCRHCGCGNDVLGYKHLKSCKRPHTAAHQS